MPLNGSVQSALETEQGRTPEARRASHEDARGCETRIGVRSCAVQYLANSSCSCDRRVMNRVSGAALVAIVSLTGLACARTSRHSDSPNPSTFLAQLDTTCDFVPEMDHPNPTILANELVQRASRAEFARTETWMPTAVTCVGHEPGYDTFEIVRSFSLISLDSTLTMKRMILRRVIIGYYSGGHFSPHDRVGVDTLLIESTPFGWRIQNPVWNWVTLPFAKQRKWVADTTR